MATEEQIKEFNLSLKKVGDELKTYAEKSEKEIAKHGQLTQETRAEVDKLLATQTEIKAKLDAAMQEIANIPRHVEAGKPKSFGSMIVNAEGAKEQLSAMANGSTNRARMTVSAALTNDSLGIAEPDRQGGIAELGRQRFGVRDLLRWGRTSSDSVTFWRQTTRTNNADVVSENPASGKPESSMGGSLIQVAVATIAHFERASKQVLSDYAMLQSFIDMELRYGLRVKEEQQLLYGTGTGLEINGLHTQATDYSQPSGVDVTSETRVDRLRLAILQAELANYYADGIVLSLVDWTNIELQKDSQNQYLLGNPYGMMTPTLWGRPVVSTASMDNNDFLVGAFGTAAMGWDREMASVAISYEDGDNFTKNMVTMLCEERIALTVKQTGAFIKGDFDGLAS